MSAPSPNPHSLSAEVDAEFQNAALLYALSGVKGLLGLNTALLFLVVLRLYGVL